MLDLLTFTMSIYLYLDRETFFHRLNPITKILSLLLLFVSAMAFTHPLYLIFLFLMVLLVLSRADALANIRRVWVIMVSIAIFSTLLWTFFYHGETYRESFFYGLGMGIRLNSMLLAGVVFLSCTRIEDFTAGLHKMGLPFPISFALSLAFRLVPRFVLTGLTVIQAQKARGLDLESGNLFQRLRKHIPLLIPILISALRNVDLLAMALESRGFGAGGKRTYFTEYRYRKADWGALITISLLTATCLFLSFSGYGKVG